MSDIDSKNARIEPMAVLRNPRRLPDAVRVKEDAYIAKRQEVICGKSSGNSAPDESGAKCLDLDPVHPVGLALSGGGIRSATFSLGILQALASHRIFPLADFLSTVSGGGYIGSFLTSLLTFTERKPCGSDQPSTYDTQENFPLKDPDQIHHLRKHGNFLIARGGVFRRDSLRAIGTVIGAISASLAVFLAMLVMLAGGFVAFTSYVGDGEIWRTMQKDFATEVGQKHPDYRGGSKELVVVHSVEGGETSGTEPRKWTETQTYKPKSKEGFDWRIALLQFRPSWSWIGFFSLGGLLIAGSVTFVFARWGVPRIRDDQEQVGPAGELPSDRIERHLLVWYSGVVISVITAAVVIVACLAENHQEASGWLLKLHDEVYDPKMDPTGESPIRLIPGARIFLLASASFAGAVASLWIAWLYISLKHARRQKDTDPTKADEKRTKDRRERSFVSAAYGLALAVLLVSLAVPALMLVTWWFHGFYLETGLIGLVALAATRILATVGGGEKGVGTLTARLRKLALGLLLRLSALLLLLAASVVALGSLLTVMGPEPLPGWFGFFVAAGALGVLAVLFWLIDFNHVSMHYFYRDRLIETYLQTEADRGHSLHLVRADENLAIRDLHRSAANEKPGEIPTNAAPYHLLVTALNLPGSRDLARRDRKSDHFIFSRFFCGSQTTGYVPTEKYDDGQTLLARVMTVSGAAASSLMGFHTFFSQAFAMTLFNIRLGYWVPNPSHYEDNVARWSNTKSKPSRRPFWPWYLFRELKASANAREAFVNLSDGAHTGDNVGLYPLFQRRCRLIIACDGEADSDYDFGSLASAIRQIFTDENVQVDIDLSDFEKDPATGRVRRHYAVGRIQYPHDKNAYARGDVGWLLYLKAAYVGDEGAPVRSYRRQCPDFPHQTTADQFFSDDQFEAYRSLGEQTARKIACLIKRRSAGECDYVDASEEFELEKQSITVEAITDWCEKEFNKAFSGKTPACGLQDFPGS